MGAHKSTMSARNARRTSSATTTQAASTTAPVAAKTGEVASRMSNRLLVEAATGVSAWGKITELAQQPGAINLGQGFPDFPASFAACEAAVSVLDKGTCNQYSAMPGSERICKAVSALYHHMYPLAQGGSELNPTSQVCITTSGSEALFCSTMGLVNPGDEVVLFEPFFPWYMPWVRMAGGVPKVVKLAAPSFDLLSVEAEVRAAFSAKTKLCIFNSPHNPSGHCATAAELELLAGLCREYDVICLSDEVYEACIYPGAAHRRMCEVEGMWDRTLTVGSASKMFSLTGWRVGWVTGPEDLVMATRLMHSYVTFCAPAPLQDAVAAAMEAEVPALRFDDRAALMHDNWEMLAAALRHTGVDICPAEGGYFLVADISATGMSDMEYVSWLATEHKVVAVPMSVFYCPSESAGDDKCTLVRFAVCKEKSTMERAVAAVKDALVDKAQLASVANASKSETE